MRSCSEMAMATKERCTDKMRGLSTLIEMHERERVRERDKGTHTHTPSQHQNYVSVNRQKCRTQLDE